MPEHDLPDFDALWDYDDPAASEARLRALVPQAEAVGDRSHLLQLHTQIARAQGLQRSFADAHATLDGVQLEIGDDVPRARIRYQLERGRVYNSSGNPDQALPFFLAAYELATAARQDFYAIDAAHMLAIAAPQEDQLRWNLTALALAEASQDPRANNWCGSLFNNIGWTYHDSGRYQEALDMFERALQWRLAQGKERPIRIARWCIARTLRSLGRIQEALAMQQSLLQEWEHGGEQDGYVYEEMGECLLALGRDADAQPYFALAYAKLSLDPWLAESEPARIARLKQLAGE